MKTCGRHNDRHRGFERCLLVHKQGPFIAKVNIGLAARCTCEDVEKEGGGGDGYTAEERGGGDPPPPPPLW